MTGSPRQILIGLVISIACVGLLFCLGCHEHDGSQNQTGGAQSADDRGESANSAEFALDSLDSGSSFAGRSTDESGRAPFAVAEKSMQQLFADMLERDAFVGSVMPNERAVRRIHLENVSEYSIAFTEIRRSCSCVGIVLPERPVNPGELVEILVNAFDPGGSSSHPVIRHWAEVGAILVDGNHADRPAIQTSMRIPIEFSLSVSIFAMPPRIDVEAVSSKRVSRRLFLRSNVDPLEYIAHIRGGSGISFGEIARESEFTASVDVFIDPVDFVDASLRAVEIDFNNKIHPTLVVPVSVRICE